MLTQLWQMVKDHTTQTICYDEPIGLIKLVQGLSRMETRIWGEGPLRPQIPGINVSIMVYAITQRSVLKGVRALLLPYYGYVRDRLKSC